MRIPARTLLNTAEIELWPAWLLRARANGDARILSRASRVLRRKCDGRYLAAVLPEGLMPLVPRLAREAGVDEVVLNVTGVYKACGHQAAMDDLKQILAAVTR